ncbi:MAG TPA: hypothetical protein VMR95_03960 [Candidatus Binatia bacterium]|nr:hypothetical protein [Candidatus Binatia bacterium]
MSFTKIIKQIANNKLLILYISPFIIYLLVAYLLYGPAHFTDIHRDIFTPSGDPLASVWYLRWWPFSIAHGLNPIMEKFAYYPNRFDLAWSTSIFTLAIFMAPITAIWGALTSFNVLALLALPITALCCYYLIFYLTKKYWTSVLCGFIYGFSSFQLAELLGHDCFYVSFIPPLVVLMVLMRLKDRLGRIPFIIILGVLLAMQFGIATEGYGSLYLFGGGAWVLTYIFADKKLRPKLLKATVDIVLASVLGLIILTPFIYYLIKGYSGVPAVVNSPLGYSADLLNYIIPTKITFIGGNLFANVSKNFTGNASEQGAYLGVPLILFIVGYGIFNWRKWYTKVLVILAGLIALASLGPKLQINGKIESLSLPWTIATHLPVLRSMLPTRFPMYIFLVASIMLGLWLSNKPKATKKKQRKAKLIQASKYSLVIVIIIMLLPATSNYFWAPPNLPSLFTPKLTKQYIGLNNNVLILPLNDGADPEFWQVSSDMEFKTTDGYLGFVPNFVINSGITVEVSSDMPGPGFVPDFLGFLKANDVSEIVYTPAGLPQTVKIVKIINSLNWTTLNVGGATIIKVPPIYQ